MKDRVKSTKRILAVQSQLVKLAEWRLEAAKRDTAAFQADQTRLQEFVGNADHLNALMADAVFKRGKQLQAAVVRSQTSVAQQSVHKDMMKRREKLAEGLAGEARADSEREAEKRQLQEIVEAAFASGDASFP